MIKVEVATPACLGCGDWKIVVMTQDQLQRWRKGEPLQDVFPDWSPEDRQRLISGTCPSCWEEMWAEEEEDWVEDPDNDPLYAPLEYERDWYVD